MKSLCLLLIPCAVLALAGCSTPANQACVSSFYLSVSVNSPGGTGSSQMTGAADHNLPAPGNEQQFMAGTGAEAISGDCAIPQVVALVRPQWTVSDAVDLKISSADDETNGLATCLGTTLTPATVTANYTEKGVTKSTSTTMTCK